MDLTQIIVIVILVVFLIILIAVGSLIYLMLKELRDVVHKISIILDEVEGFSRRVTSPMNTITLLLETFVNLYKAKQHNDKK
jgi:hypothetical protein